MQVVPIESVAQMVRLHTEKIDDLTKGGIYLFSRHVDSLRATQSEATNRSDLVDGFDREDFVNEGRLLKPGEQLLDCRRLVVHLVLRVLLQVELLLELVELSPELPLVVLNVLAVALEVLNLPQLLQLFIIDRLELLVKLSEFALELLPLFGLLGIVISLQLGHLKLKVLLDLLELLAIRGSLFLFLHNLLVQLVEYFIEAGEANWVFDLEASLFADVALNQIFHEQVRVRFLANLGKHVQVLVLYLAFFRDATGDLVRLHVGDVVELGRVLQRELLIEDVGGRGARLSTIAVIHLLQNEWL